MKKSTNLIQDLNAGMILSGQMSSVHATSLEKYLQLAFDGLEKGEIVYNLNVNDPQTGVGGSQVLFKVQLGPNQTESDIPRAVKALITATKGLFWQDLDVKVVDFFYKPLISEQQPANSEEQPINNNEQSTDNNKQSNSSN